MAFDTTITENDLDDASRTFVQGLKNGDDFEPDLAVDGLTDSILSRLLGIFGLGRRH